MGRSVRYEYHGYTFTWDSTKAETNLRKHGVSFEEACAAVLNEIQLIESADEESEERWAVIAYARSDRFVSPLYVVIAEREYDAWRIISARVATSQERKRYEEEVNTH
jgi:uncharacterized protein